MLPVLGGFATVVGASNLIEFAMNNKNHTDRSERGRENQDQNPALQCLDHSSAGRSRLSVTERAALGKSRHSGQQQDQCCQGKPCEPKVRFTFHSSSQELTRPQPCEPKH